MMKNPSLYLKLRVLSAIDFAEGNNLKERYQKVSSMIFTDEKEVKCQFTWRTIQTWHYYYKRYGITRLDKITRGDKGTHRKTTPEELLEAINQVLPLYRNRNHYNKSDIYRKCIEKEILRKEDISQTSFYRFIREYELLKNNTEDNKKRMAFSMQFANQLWQADTMYGPYIKNAEGKMIQTRLIAFIDDASRLICHGQFFFNENTDALVTAIRSAFYKRGIPEQLYVDNGSIYTSAEITLICARIGCILRHAPLRDGAAKGKIERFFRRTRDQFLLQNLDLSSISTLNKQFNTWVEEKYNSTKHSAIGMKPIDRFGMDLKRIKFLSPGQENDELFYNEETRKVKKDNTFSFKGTRYEAPAYLPDKTITIRFDRTNLTFIIVYHKDQRIGKAKLLDQIANGKIFNRKEKKS